MASDDRSVALQCTQCSQLIPSDQIQLNVTVHKMACGRGHFRHSKCMDGCRKCTCAKCGQLTEQTESIQVATCFCKFHTGCLPVRSWITPGTSLYVCPRHKQRVHSISPKIPEPTSPWAFLYGTFSAWELKHKTVTDYDPLVLSPETIVQSDVSILNLINAGFSLHDLMRFGVDGATFLRRFFAPAVLFHLLRLGPVHGYHTQELVTGERFMRALGLSIKDLLAANVGLLTAPPEAQPNAYVRFQACHLSQMGLTLDNLVEFGLTFELFLDLNSACSEWKVVSHAIGEHGKLGWVTQLPYNERYKRARGTALERIGWTRPEVASLGLETELAPLPPDLPAPTIFETLLGSLIVVQQHLTEPPPPAAPITPAQLVLFPTKRRVL